MKAKLETCVLAIIMISSACLLKTNEKIDGYQEYNQEQSTANYIQVEETTDENLIASDISKESEKIIEVVEKDPIVYDGLTLNELSDKLNRSLNSTISGKGYLIASHSLEMGVDPYMAVAIMLHETGCKWDCSYLVNACNNVGGQKGTGCGGYSYFNSIDEGITAFIDNLYNNYISYNLTTPELINPKYAEDTAWSENVNAYIEIIRAQ